MLGHDTFLALPHRLLKEARPGSTIPSENCTRGCCQRFTNGGTGRPSCARVHGLGTRALLGVVRLALQCRPRSFGKPLLIFQ